MSVGTPGPGTDGAAPVGQLRVRELTPPGRGALAVLELAGAEAAAALSRLTGRRAPAVGELGLRRLRSAAGELLDEALVVGRAPTRFELHLHGSPVVVRRLRDELGGAPAPACVGGQCELARAQLSRAPSEALARVLLDQAEGALARDLARLVVVSPELWRVELKQRAREGRALMRALRPPTCVLAGPTNAGKSTLFNLLIGQERAVTSAQDGTTRDVLRERVALGDYAVELVDTAGERIAPEPEEFERAGQALGRRAREGAELVLWLDPDGQPPSEPPRAAWRLCASRAQRAQPLAQPPRLASLEDPAGTRALVEALVLDALKLPPQPWLPARGLPLGEAGVRALEELALIGGPSTERQLALERSGLCGPR